jgi:hypothetical protein
VWDSKPVTVIIIIIIISATLHQPGRRKKQDRQPLDVAALTAELQVLTLTLK